MIETSRRSANSGGDERWTVPMVRVPVPDGHAPEKRQLTKGDDYSAIAFLAISDKETIDEEDYVTL